MRCLNLSLVLGVLAVPLATLSAADDGIPTSYIAVAGQGNDIIGTVGLLPRDVVAVQGVADLVPVVPALALPALTIIDAPPVTGEAVVDSFMPEIAPAPKVVSESLVLGEPVKDAAKDTPKKISAVEESLTVKPPVVTAGIVAKTFGVWVDKPLPQGVIWPSGTDNTIVIGAPALPVERNENLFDIRYVKMGASMDLPFEFTGSVLRPDAPVAFINRSNFKQSDKVGIFNLVLIRRNEVVFERAGFYYAIPMGKKITVRLAN
jgi:hypothetical protein